MMRACSCFLLLLIAVRATTGRQAPGDEDDVCENVYWRRNELVLMSSLHYRNLIWGGPWTFTDNDPPGDSGHYTWYRLTGKPCRRALSTCFYWRCPQDNWLITQFVNNTMRQVDIYVRVKYSIQRWNSARTCLAPSTPAIDMYVLQTNRSNIAFTASNISGIFVAPPVATLTDTVKDGFNHYITRIIKVTADLSTAGLYVAFRDRGVCFSLYELTVFYPVCDVISLDLGASFLGMMRFAGVTSTGVCFDKMAVSLNPFEDRLNATCGATVVTSRRKTDWLFTNWTADDNNIIKQCICQPGYVFTDRTTIPQCQKYNCTATADKVKEQLHTLRGLNYHAIRTRLLAESVITNVEERIIDRKVVKGKMRYLITKIIMLSLKQNSCIKFKGLLEAMENSHDGEMRNAAKVFGGSKSVQA